MRKPGANSLPLSFQLKLIAVATVGALLGWGAADAAVRKARGVLAGSRPGAAARDRSFLNSVGRGVGVLPADGDDVDSFLIAHKQRRRRVSRPGRKRAAAIER